MVVKICFMCGLEVRYASAKTMSRRNKTGLCRECYLAVRRSAKNTDRKPVIYRLGYRLILAPNHPYCTKEGYVREHRLVVENHIGRYLFQHEIVHHKNGDKLDNRLENLEVMLQSDHARMHRIKNRTCGLCNRKHVARGFCDKHYYSLHQKHKMKQV